MKKNLLLIFFSTFISIILFYFILCVYTFVTLNKSGLKKFNTLSDLNYHKKYSAKLHHLRYPSLINSEYLFTTINSFENKQKKILFQGDSWVEILTQPDYGNLEARNFIKDFSNKNDFGFISAGITSYSPSLIKLQLEILEKDFDIKPNIIITFIDQTDIGDENCRYKDNKVFNNNKLIGIKNDSYTKLPFDYSKMYGESEILLKARSKISTAVILLNFRIKYLYLKIKNKNLLKFKNIIKYGYKKRKFNKCYWTEIQRYLYDAKNNEIDYFNKTVDEYINYIENNDFIEKLFFVTFPHKNNLPQFFNLSSKPYKYDVSDIISNLIENKKKIHHINFTKLIKEKKVAINNNFYKKNDPGSHLTSYHYTNVFIKKILEIVNLEIK